MNKYDVYFVEIAKEWHSYLDTVAAIHKLKNGIPLNGWRIAAESPVRGFVCWGCAGLAADSRDHCRFTSCC